MYEENIAIIVVNYNNYLLTQKCVTNLLHLKVKSHIVIVDNCSTNESFVNLTNFFMKFENVKVIQSEKNGGYSYGNNYGIHFAEKKWNIEFICIMNPDVIIEDNYFEKLCQKLIKKDDYAAIAPFMFLAGHFKSDCLSWNLIDSKKLYKEFNLLKFNKNQRKTEYNIEEKELLLADVLPGCFFIIKKSKFEEIGYFDENIFLYHEEDIIGLKFKNLNYKLLLDSSCYYLHNHFNNDKEKVLYEYKYNFKNVRRNYDYEYNSRLYLCEKFFHNQNKLKLQITKIFNSILLEAKHLYAVIKCTKKKA